MGPLNKDQALKIAELSSSTFQQGSSWVFQELDFETGVYKLTRGLSEKAAQQRLRSWRKERIEQLLRSTPEATAYTIQSWQENPNWNGGGIWQWVQNCWYTTREDAEKALEKHKERANNKTFQIYETKTEKIPGHFVVA